VGVAMVVFSSVALSEYDAGVASVAAAIAGGIFVQ
jgi:hypothetical protein